MPVIIEPTRPRRVQRKRTKGWKMPANTVYVGRPSKWGNPYKIGDIIMNERINASRAVKLYFAALHNHSHPPHCYVEEVKKELRGRNLACWCPLNILCHADILLEMAND